MQNVFKKGVIKVCRLDFIEYQDTHERVFQKSDEEKRQESNSTKIAKCLAGQQYQGYGYILKHLKGGYIQ
jgi:hypothetical protein